MDGLEEKKWIYVFYDAKKIDIIHLNLQIFIKRISKDSLYGYKRSTDNVFSNQAPLILN